MMTMKDVFDGSRRPPGFSLRFLTVFVILRRDALSQVDAASLSSVLCTLPLRDLSLAKDNHGKKCSDNI